MLLCTLSYSRSADAAAIHQMLITGADQRCHAEAEICLSPWPPHLAAATRARSCVHALKSLTPKIPVRGDLIENTCNITNHGILVVVFDFLSPFIKQAYDKNDFKLATIQSEISMTLT